MITAGQNVKNASSPGPIGLGFGSLSSPSSAASMIASRGPVPTTSSASPIQNTSESLNRSAESIGAQVSGQLQSCRESALEPARGSATKDTELGAKAAWQLDVVPGTRVRPSSGPSTSLVPG